MKPTKAYLKALEAHNEIFPRYLEALTAYLEASRVTSSPPLGLTVLRNRLSGRIACLEHTLIVESRGKWRAPNPMEALGYTYDSHQGYQKPKEETL